MKVNQEKLSFLVDLMMNQIFREQEKVESVEGNIGESKGVKEGEEGEDVENIVDECMGKIKEEENLDEAEEPVDEQIAMTSMQYAKKMAEKGAEHRKLLQTKNLRGAAEYAKERAARAAGKIS